MQLLFRSRIFVVLSHFNGLFHFSSYGKMNLMFESVHRIALKRYIRYGEIKFSPVRGVNIQKDSKKDLLCFVKFLFFEFILPKRE